MGFLSHRTACPDGPIYPTKKRRTVRLLWRWVGWAALLFFALAGVVAYEYARHLNSSPHRVALCQVEIAPGMTARQVGEELESRGIIRSARFFSFAARLMEFDRHIRAGAHWIDGFKPTVTILRQLLSGGLSIVRFTVPEGLTIEEMADIVAANLPVIPDSFVAAANDSALVARYAFPGASSLEGFLFPDTYNFDANAGSRAVVRTMATRFHELFTPTMEARAESLRMTLLEVLTLASIIEKEAMVDRERPIVSQVFHKRLKIGYRLEADPTVKYVMERNRRRLSLRDIEIDSPYNTYRNHGLPPGPICNPGIESIRAALWPAETDYLYFVANWDGTHTFTRSLREHNVAKVESERKYRQWRARPSGADQRRRTIP